MTNGTARYVKGIMGVVIVIALLLVVSNWWGDYKRAAPQTPTQTATSTVESTKTASGDTSSTVVVLIDGLNFRKKPASDAATIRGLKKGERLALVKTEGNWYQVKDSKGTVGYVAAKPQYVRVGK